MALTDSIATLATQRQLEDELGSRLSKLKAEFDAKHADLIERVRMVKAEVAATETTVRDEAVQLFNQSGNPKPVPGVQVVQMNKVVYDAAEALKWAISRRVAVELNRASFEALAKNGQAGIPAKVEKVSFTRISSDLSAYVQTRSASRTKRILAASA